jgi:predicted nucleic acid-binding Zn ribbon protein
MSRRTTYDDDDLDDEDEEPTQPCPYCRAEIHEDAQQCPRCGRYISDEDAPSRKPWWVIVGALICLYVVFRWIVG